MYVVYVVYVLITIIIIISVSKVVWVEGCYTCYSQLTNYCVEIIKLMLLYNYTIFTYSHTTRTHIPHTLSHTHIIIEFGVCDNIS